MKKMYFALFFFLSAAQSSYGELNWVDFTVTRHTDTTFAQATIDNDMNVINERIKYDNHDCTVDVPCSVRFVRSGVLGVFGSAGDGLDIITTQGELDSVFAVGTHRAKVVTSIDYCAGGYNTSIVGCGRCYGFGYILETGQPGNVYVHEFGHNVMGCGHRDDCNMNIMHSITNGNNNALDSTECAGFGGSSYVALCGDVYDGHGGPLTVSGGPYWVTCNVTVPAGQILTINPGVEIQFDQGDRMIKSYGTTNANGDTTGIVIYSNNETNNYPTATIDGPLTISSGGELILD